MDDIILSDKYGVNPAIPVCYYCGKEKNMLILAGRLKGDAEAPQKAVWDMEPCDACQERRKTQVHFIVTITDQSEGVERQRLDWLAEMAGVPDSKKSPFMPHVARTGGDFWLEDDLVSKIVVPVELCEQILRSRWVFIPMEAVDLLRQECSSKPAVGDVVSRVMGAGGPSSRLKISEITETEIVCGRWKFDKATGAEIDEELGWGPPPLATGSYLQEFVKGTN
jgi:hypothetical protein